MPLVNLALNVLKLGWDIGKTLASRDWMIALAQAFSLLQAMFNDLVNTWVWQGVREAQVWNGNLHPAAVKMREDTLKAFGDTSASLNHIVDVIIPNSVKNGTHKVWTQGIAQVRRDLNDLGLREGKTQRELTTLHNYINHQVNPYITGYRAFVKVFDHVWGPALRELLTWEKQPAKLSARLAPSMTPDVVEQLGRKSGRRSLDLLARELLGHAPSLVNVIDRTAVAVLSSGKYDIRH